MAGGEIDTYEQRPVLGYVVGANPYVLSALGRETFIYP